MNNRAFALALLMAIVSGYLIYTSLEKMQEDNRKVYGVEVMVLKAKRDIKEQESISQDMWVKQVIPKKFQEPSAFVFTDLNEDNDNNNKLLKSLEGVVALVPIQKGEQITRSKVTEPGIRTGLAPQIAPGKRAVALPVNEVTGVAKLVKPGDRVDVIAIMDPGSGRSQKIAKTILQDVVVLSVGRNVTSNEARIKDIDSNSGKTVIRSLSDDASFASITVEVEPAQAQMISLITANTENVINLSLRNNDDQEHVSVPPGTVLNDLLGTDAARLRLPAGNPGGGGRP